MALSKQEVLVLFTKHVHYETIATRIEQMYQNLNNQQKNQILNLVKTDLLAVLNEKRNGLSSQHDSVTVALGNADTQIDDVTNA